MISHWQVVTNFLEKSANWRWNQQVPLTRQKPSIPYYVTAHSTGAQTLTIKLSTICGNKMPTRCNRGFYCRSYCLLNMFRAPLCPSSGAKEYYTVVAACGIWCCGFQVAGLVWSWRLCVSFVGCCSILQTRHIALSSTPDQQFENHSTKYHRQQPLYNTLWLLMMGICPKHVEQAIRSAIKTSVASSWHFISTY